MRRRDVVSMAGVIFLCAVTAATGLERYSVGTADNPWTEGYASTGETDLTVMTETGMMPFRVDPSVNLVKSGRRKGQPIWELVRDDLGEEARVRAISIAY